MEKVIGKCPVCGADFIKNQFGGWGCSEFRNGCRTSIYNPIAGKKITEEMAVKLINGETTEIIEGFIGRSGKEFNARLIFNKKKGGTEFIFDDRYEPTDIECPVCQHGTTLNKYEKLYKCPVCDYRLFTTIAQHKISEADVRVLCHTGKTEKIQGFVSRAGKSFSARLLLDEDFRVLFSFD